MQFFPFLKTSEKISLSFALFGFFSLIIFLVLINISYFFIWYSDQKAESFSEVNQYYNNYQSSNGSPEDIKKFRDYLLKNDTIIIPERGNLVCSPGVAKKIHENPEEISSKLFYRDGDTIYFIYSKYFKDIGEVKIFFDTTPYINSQITIIKISLIFIVIAFLFQFFLGKLISGYLLRDLKNITKKIKHTDINSKDKHIVCPCMPPDDEIHILAKALNTSYDHIDAQTLQLKQFLTDVAHEFKTPLMMMNSRIDLSEKKIQKGQYSEYELGEFFSDFRRHISSLNALLETLFFLSRVEEKKYFLQKKDLRIKTYIQQKQSDFFEKFPEKNIDFHYDIHEELHYKVDLQTFSILLDNLLGNAIKFSPQNAKITIEAKKNFLSISDNGPGISDEMKTKIWNKFYRNDTKKEGFGVGLYLVKRIIDIYGWDIQVDNNPDLGAHFTIYF